jgi:CheY-like chemotaxis protein
MELNALLMCREHESLRMLVGALDEFGIDEEVCASEPEAMQLLALGYYSALIVDFDLPGAAQVVRMAHLAPANRRPVVFALIGDLTGVGSTFQAGANFVLYKPLVREQMERSLRAGQAFMRADRRRSPRQKTDALVYLRFGDVCPVPALVLEISEDGLSVQASEPLPAVELPLRFILPGTSSMIEGSGEVTWADDCGRGGIFFSHLSPSARRQLKAWLAKRDKKKPSRARATARAVKNRAATTSAN